MLAGLGFDPDPVIPSCAKDRDCLVDNPRFSWQFFPPALARQFEPFSIPSRRPGGSFRILVLGESAAQGVPDGAYSFARVLQTILEAAYPDVSFEMINAGMTAINSHVIYQIAKGLIRQGPDLVVIYAGHNEVIGPFGPGTVFAPFQRRLWLIRASIALGRTRIGQLMRLYRIRDQQRLLKSWGGMEMFTSSRISPTDPALATVYSHFYTNLRDTCKLAARSGAMVVLCTPASNMRDCPPFASMHRPSLDPKDLAAWQQAFDKAAQAEADGRYELAIQFYAQALEKDDQYAQLHYRLARCLENVGRTDQARDHYIAARDLDALRFRADSRLCQSVRTLAKELNSDAIILADTDLACSQASTVGVPGDDLFYEHVHLNPSGNYIVAKTIAEAVLSRLDDRFGSHKPILTEQDCYRRLALTCADRYILAKRIYEEFLCKPPFTDQPYHQQILQLWQGRIKALQDANSPEGFADSVAMYRQAIADRPNDWYLHWKLGTLLADHLHDLAGAEDEFGTVLRLMPDFYLAHTALGQVCLRMDRFQEAACAFRNALQLYDVHPTTHFLLGYAYQRLGDLPKAARHYRLAAYWQPTELVYYTSLARVLRQMGKTRQADEVLKKAAEQGRR